MDTWLIPTVLLALLVGVLAGWLVTRLRHAAADAGLRAELADRDATVAEMQAAVARAQAGAAEARADVARATAERDAARSRAEEVASDREMLKAQFKALAAEQLEAQGKHTSEALLTPVEQGLRALQERITAVEKERAQMQAAMREQLTAMQDSGERLRKETASLAGALRTPQMRGTWGEQSLRRIVEISGLTSRVDFDEQVTTESGDGAKQRPDMRINLAGGKVVFVDAKVPLAAVLEATNTEDEAARAHHLAAFAKHVRTHVDALAGKHYWDLDLGSPEFVVLFLGSDECYRLAQEQAPDLHEYAARKGVMLASPGILIPMLHVIAHGWSQASLAESAAEVVALGREIHGRLSTLGGHFAALGRSLGSAVTNYNRAVSSLETRVLVTARKFGEVELTQASLDAPPTIEAAPRAVSAPELTSSEQPSGE